MNSQYRLKSLCLNFVSRIVRLHVKGFSDICGSPPDKKKGVVIGAYDTPCPGEYKLTPIGSRLNEASGDKISRYLKRTDLTEKRVCLLSDVCADLHAVAVVGLGPEDAGCSDSECLDEAKENVRIAAGLGALELHENDVTDIHVESMGVAVAAAEGASLATWNFQELKDPLSRTPEPDLELYEDPDRNSWCHGLEMADAQNLCRKLEETPANIMKPLNLGETALTILCPLNVHVDIRDAQWLEAQRMCGLLGVARGSCEPPCLLDISYCGGTEGDRPVVLVGKGVTFDSGGLHLKDHKTMVADGVLGMAGAAVIISVIKGLAALKIPININGVVPLLENMPGGLAARPGDVLTSKSGNSVLLESTENEGEIAMADCLTYSAAFNPCMVISIAALCNGLRGTLGFPASGAFSSSNSVWMELVRAAADSGDRVWRLPLWKAYSAYVTRHKAVDLTNQGVYPGGDPCTAAAFLKEFAPCCDFLHLDISGTGGTCCDVSCPYLRRGLKSGRPTRTIIQFLYQLVCPQHREL